jgi:O-antigen ligase
MTALDEHTTNKRSGRPELSIVAPREPDPPTAAPPRKTPRTALAVALLAHLALGPLMYLFRPLALLHVIVTLTVALSWAVREPRLNRVVEAAAYICACDVLWRMTRAPVFWEAGKYGVVLVLGVGLLRLVKPTSRMVLPLVYIVLLIPSTVLTVMTLSRGAARAQLSLNMSGPLALATAAVLFVHVKMSWSELRRVFLVLLLPIVSIGSIALYGIVTARSLHFTTASNASTSGGFGPNQVSASLGLGALLCLLLALRETRRPWQLFEAALALWFFGQSTLTLSRGGAFNLAVAGGILVLLELVWSQRRAQMLIVLILIGVVGFFVFSRLDTFTDGTLNKRFAETSTSRRSTLAEEDLQLWSEHKLAGVGPGVASTLRLDPALQGSAPHTEFTRLLAEHGTLGLAAMVALLALVISAFARGRTRWGQTLTLVLAAWALCEMSHAAMRLAATSFVFGLALVCVTEEAAAPAPHLSVA